MTETHYNWFSIRAVLVKHFNLILKWTESGFMEFSGPRGSAQIPKANKYPRIFMVQFLAKLDINVDEFDKAYKHVMKSD